MSQLCAQSETPESLDIVARKIEEHARKSDEEVIAAVKLIREARRRIEGGELGSVTWFEWARQNIHLKKSRLYELQHLAEAQDPVAELERQRRNSYERVKKHRRKKAETEREIEQERRDLIDWAKQAPIREINRALQFVGKRSGASLSQIEEHVTQDQPKAA